MLSPETASPIFSVGWQTHPSVTLGGEKQGCNGWVCLDTLITQHRMVLLQMLTFTVASLRRDRLYEELRL